MLQVDAIVTSVNAHGVFAEVGPLSVFVSNHVCFVFYVPPSIFVQRANVHLPLAYTCRDQMGSKCDASPIHR